MAKVMLVEDDNNLREIYEARLLAEGYEIISAHDGEEALALAVKEKPDLIISDVMMPKISGFDMLDILRSSPETKHTKVIMMTALSQLDDKDRADRLGADRYLVKSQVTLEDVIRVTKEILEDPTETSQQAEPEPLAPLPSTAPAEPPVQVPVAAPATSPVPAADPAPQAVPTEPPAVASMPVAQDPAADQSSTQPDPGVTQPPAQQDSTTAANQPATDAPTPNVPAPSVETSPAEGVIPAAASNEISHAQSVDAEQDVVEQQIEEFVAQAAETLPSEAPVSEPPAAAEPTPPAPVMPEAPVAPAPQAAPVEPAPNTPAVPEVTSPAATESADTETPISPASQGKRVIQPLNNPTTGPDLAALLDKEQEKEDLQSIMGAAPPSPPQPASGQTPNQSNGQTPPQDPNMIAL